MQKVSALFIDRNSVYKSLLDDCYDIYRNAMSFDGTHPIIAHPPCRLFSKLKALSNAPGCERLYGLFSVLMVRKFGGVIEQPNGSALWKLAGVIRQPSIDEFGGHMLSINQSWFGFPCQKRTDLYIVGIHPRDIPPYPLTLDASVFVVNSSKKGRKEIPKSMRSYTTPALAKWLISIAELCQVPTVTNQAKNI